MEQGRPECEIANDLNSHQILTDLGRTWTRGSVHQLLINEKYVGNNVWGRTSFKLKSVRLQNAPEDWVRSDGAFEGIVDRAMFERAQVIIRTRSDRLTDERMLELLAQILERRGYLSGMIIDEIDDCPSSSAFRSRLGSLLRAYTLVGFTPDHDYRYLETNRRLRQLHPSIVASIIAGVGNIGGHVRQDAATDLLTINQEFTASIVIVRCFQTDAGSLRWKLRLDTALNPDLTIAVRMDAANDQAKDYYVLPALDMREAVLRLAEYNGLSLDAYRFETLHEFYRMAARVSLRMAA